MNKVDFSKLAPVGMLKQCTALYEKQTIEFMRDGKVSEQTKQDIIDFDVYCADNGYKILVVVPLFK